MKIASMFIYSYIRCTPKETTDYIHYTKSANSRYRPTNLMFTVLFLVLISEWTFIAVIIFSAEKLFITFLGKCII